MILKRFLLGCFCISFIFFPDQRDASSTRYNKTASADDSTSVLTLSFVGDLMCHSPQYESVQAGADSFDFSPVYRFVDKYLSRADYTFGNLETVTAGKGRKYTGYPMFNSPDDFVGALKRSGFDFIFTSNNHSIDRGQFGVLQTLENIRRNKLEYCGTFSSEKDRDSIRIISKNGIRLAVLAYTYGTNGNYIPKDSPYLVNLIDTTLIRNDIKKARSSNVDLVLVYFHFGIEYLKEPVSDQVSIVNAAVNDGADIIIGSHPHVLQPVDLIKSKYSKLDSVLVVYSLGNFISGQRERYKASGVIFNIEVKKDWSKDSVYLGDLTFIPTWVYKGSTGKRDEYVILPAETAASSDTAYTFLSSYYSNRVKQSFTDSKEILTKRTKRVKLKSVIE